jgi:hypothetical protein
MDYIILSALVGVTLPRIVLTYDIACQWSKNFAKRKDRFPEDLQLDSKVMIDTAIPSWHINGHRPSCQQDYCLGHMKGVGHTCGEEVEISWSHTNPLIPSVREMGPAAHHDMLNDHWIGWNFRKVVGFRELSFYCFDMCLIILTGKSFNKKFKEAVTMKKKHEGIFTQFSATFPQSVLEKWVNVVETWERDPSAPNPYKELCSGATPLLRLLVYSDQAPSD